MPAYGGYCAVAMSEGNVVPVDPENYLIEDGVLYLFYREGDVDTLPMWKENPAQLRDAANDRFSNGNYGE